MRKFNRTCSILLTVCTLMLPALSACSSQESSAQETQPPETSAHDVTTEITATESSVTETAPQNTISMIYPDGIQFTDTAVAIPGFRYWDYVSDGGYIKLICMLDDVVYFEARESNSGDAGDLYFYQYNIRTGESEKFDGCVQDFYMSSDSWALVGTNLYGTIETPDVQVHYQIDLPCKKITPLKVVPLNRDTDGFVDTFAVDDEHYIETSFHMEKNTYTYHVILYSPDEEKEIITKSSHSRNEFYAYKALDGIIYEYSQKNNISGSTVSTYNTNGELLSSDTLAEVTYELAGAPDAYLDHFLVTNRFMAFNIGYEMPVEKCIVYDCANGKVTIINDARFLKTPQNAGSDGIYAMIAHAKSEDAALCCWNGDASFSGILRGMDLSFSAVQSGKTIVYLNGQVLYKFDAQ